MFIRKHIPLIVPEAELQYLKDLEDLAACRPALETFLFDVHSVHVEKLWFIAFQRRLFEELGTGILENVWAGYNCTLFAYGQTGSGKSYSMMGYDVNKGSSSVNISWSFRVT